jgi:hypothetical protein
MGVSTQQDIIVKIKAIVDGLSNVRELAQNVKDLKDLKIGGGQAGDVGKLGEQINKLADAVEKLSAGSKKVDGSKLQALERFVVAVNAVVQVFASIETAVEGFNKVVSFFRSIPDLAERGRAGFSKVTSAVSEFVTGLRSKFRAGATDVERDASRVGTALERLAQKVTGGGGKAGGSQSGSLLSKLFGGGASSGAGTGAGVAAEAEEAAVAGAGLSSVVQGVEKLGSGLVEKASAALASLTERLATLGEVGLALLATLALITAAIAVFAAGVIGLGVSVGVGAIALEKIATRGLQTQRQLEQVRLGIAGVVTSIGQIKVNGIPVEGAQKFAVAMGLASGQLKKLQVDAINTTATFEQIAPAFQAALAPGLAAKLTLDQIREITVKIVQAASAIGLPLNQVDQEVRSILDGTIDQDSRVAHVLGLSNEMVKKWKEQGKLAAELNKRLEGFATAGEAAAQTFDGLTSNLVEALNVFSAHATAHAFDALKAEFQKLLPELFDFKNAGLNKQFESLARLADDVLTRLVRIAGSIAQDIVNGLQRAAQFVQNNRELIDQVLALLEAAGKQLYQILGFFVQIGTDTMTWRTTLLLVRDVLILVNIILAQAVSQLRQAAPFLQLLLLAANLTARAHFGVGIGSPKEGTPRDVGAALAGGAIATSIPAAVSVSSSGTPAAGKKGSGEHSKVPELQRALDRATIEATLAEVQAKFERIKQDVDESVQAIKDGLADATVSISEAYRLEAAFADKSLQAEKDRIAAELAAAKQRRDLAVRDLDPKLKPEERRLAIAAEDKKLAVEITKLEGERARLVEKTANDKARLVNEEAKAQQQLQDSMADIERQADALSNFAGTRAEAAAGEIEARFRETRRQLVANFGEASAQVEHLDELIQKLTERAKFQELAKDVENAFGRLRGEEDRLSDDVARGQISAADALKKRLELERAVKRQVYDTLAGLKAVAEQTGDPELLEAVKRLEHEWGNLGKAIDETAKRIDDTIRRGLEDTLTNIITRTKTVGEAFRQLAVTILAEIARILAVNFVEKLFGGILRTNPQGTSIGGILAPILTDGASNGTQRGSSSGNVFGSIDSVLKGIPGIIINFNRSATQGLGGLKSSTDGMRDDVRGGFGQVNSNFGSAIGLLGNIASGILGMAAAAVAGVITNIIKIAGAGAAPQAQGGFQTATPGGRLIRVAEAGFDEVIIPTDPKHRKRASRLIGEFLKRTGVVPDFGAVVLEGALAGVPSFAAGGFALEGVTPAPYRDGDMIHISVPVSIQTPNRQSFVGSEQSIMRDIGRAAQKGVRRAKSQQK